LRNGVVYQSSIQPSDIPLEREKQHPNPLSVPHTLGDFNGTGGHPQFPRQELLLHLLVKYPTYSLVMIMIHDPKPWLTEKASSCILLIG
jgi:hypothetical protein